MPSKIYFFESGNKIGRWTLIEDTKKYSWLCECDCGNRKIVDTHRLINGQSRSCGCLARLKNSKRMTTHGMSTSRIYCIWRGIRDRCRNKNVRMYKNYGGRGIGFCDKWLNFGGFMEDMKNGYKDNLTIDRIDNSRGYYKENCRWVDMKTQNRNRRNNKIINFNGIKKCSAEWSEITGINRATIEGRLKRGWDEERSLTTPVKHLLGPYCKS